jgi:peroxin-16
MSNFEITTLLQIFNIKKNSRCIGRLILYIKYKKISKSPPIQPADRKDLQFGQNGELLQKNANIAPSVTFKLKRSGKVIRKVANSPGLYNRDFKEIPISECNESEFQESKGVKHAELIYIFKPLIHLGSMKAFGINSWKSFSTSLLLDLLSIKIYYDNRIRLKTKEEKKELSRRCVALILYVFKSPFYDQYSKNKIEAFLIGLSKCLPCFNPLLNPLLTYIPHWQSTYFYLWSS